ncbi:MAG: McrC family protein [Bacteroidaceae bacterium]|nr:McrC family protein [Bacteroidaceae bacterium]
MALRVIAKDNMPFFISSRKNDKEEDISYAENAIGDVSSLAKSDKRHKASDALVQMLESVAPIPIDDKHYRDEDSRLAYPYFDKEGFLFRRSKDDETTWVRQRAWHAGRYIGEIVINDIQISIKPRFGESCLFAMLGELYHFNLLKSDSSKSKIQKKDWNELMHLIMNHLWIRKFALANKYGLPRKTVLHSQKGLQVRGHINIHKSISSYIATKQIVSEYREKELDYLVCSIVYRAYKVLSKISISKSSIPQNVQDAINTLVTKCKGQDFNISKEDYKNIEYKSIYQSWKPLVDLSWQIIHGKSLSIENVKDGSGMCLFLDMAEIWEAYLRKVLGVALGTDNWEVLPQYDCETEVYNGMFYGRTIIPDIVLKRELNGKSQYMVFDAKYKRMTGNKNDVDRSDFFQIHSYIQYYSNLPNSEVLVGGLLYPLDENFSLDDSCSDSLFGLPYNNTSFMVDGLYLSNNEEEIDSEYLKTQISGLVERIRKLVDS